MSSFLFRLRMSLPLLSVTWLVADALVHIRRVYIHRKIRFGLGLMGLFCYSWAPILDAKCGWKKWRQTVAITEKIHMEW